MDTKTWDAFIALPEDALWALSTAQRIQDGTLPWASALGMARESVYPWA